MKRVALAGVIIFAGTLTHVWAGYTLQYPVGGETFRVGDTVVVRWTATVDQYLCKLQISLDDGITLSAVNTKSIAIDDTVQWGHYRWVIPDTTDDGTQMASSSCIMFIKPYSSDLAANDVTKSPFTIKPRGWMPSAAEEPKKGGCGNGAGLALIPPFFLKFARKRRR